MSRKRRKKKRVNKVKVIIFIVIILIIISVISLVGYKMYQEKQKEISIQNQKNDILSHYNEFVITNKESNIYKLDNNEYINAGKISANQELTLAKKEITYEDKYLKITTFDEEYYIYYKDIDSIETLSNQEDRYKRYIVFNKNIVTKDTTNFYDEEGNLVYTLDSSFDLPIIVNQKDIYGVEFNNRLLYVKKEDVSEVKKQNNTQESIAKKIRTLAYHRIYDPKTEKCDQVICHTEEQFESHIKYLHDNNFLTLTTKELELFIDNKIQLPKKSIVLTIDDGTLVKRSIPILEKYDLNASLFLVTSRFKEQDYIDFTSDNLELHSHTHNMHKAGQCAGYGSQGGGILCLDESDVLEDLKTSQEILKGSTVFCYPFYDYSTRAIKLLQQAGFTMAFAGELNTYGYTYVGTNKMLIPRVTIVSYTTFTQFKNYVSYGF